MDYPRYAFNVTESANKMTKLSAAGISSAGAYELFKLGRKLLHHGIIECNRERTGTEIAEQYGLIEEASNLTHKHPGIVSVELGDPRGRVLKVELRKPDGTSINGDDFGDSRLLCL